jgi:hypothetical protein
MKDSLRRPILFAVIVITGSVLILFDIPLIIMIPVVLVVGFVILIILGAITIAEIKNSLKSLKPSNLKKIGIIKKLDEMKFFEKPTPAQKGKILPVKAEVKQPEKPEVKQPVKSPASTFHSFFQVDDPVVQGRNEVTNQKTG